MSLSLVSADFDAGGNIPAVHTCDGSDTVTLKAVTMASLSASDFTFHAPSAPAASWAAYTAAANSHLHTA